MSNYRLILPLLVAAVFPLLVLAQDPFQPQSAPPDPEPPTEAETTLDEAIAKVGQIDRVRARIRQSVDMLGQQFTIEGEYLKADDYVFRLELQVDGLPETSGEMAQISDGKVLWDYSRILDQPYFYRLNLDRVFEKLDGPPFNEQDRAFFIQQRLGLSGPKALLDGLRQSARFDRKTEGTLDGKDVWILRGQWKDMAAFGLGPLATPPAYMPSLVNVWIDKETGWPYRVLLTGQKRSTLAVPRTPKIDPTTGRPVGNIISQEEPPSRFELTYSEVELDPEFSEGSFAFEVPADQTVQDRTELLMAELDQAAQVIRAQRSGEAAKDGESGSVLEGAGLNVPPIEGETQFAPNPAPSPSALPGRSAPGAAPPGG